MGILGQTDSDEPAILFFLAVGVAVASVVICVQKGKPEMAILAILIFPVAIIGALPIAVGTPALRTGQREGAALQ